MMKPERPWLRSRRLPAIVISTTLAIFALGLLAVTLHLRKEIHEDVVRREGEVLHSVAMMLQAEEERALLEEPSTQLDVLLKTSRLQGVIAARLFDPEGQLSAVFPPNVKEAALAPPDVQVLKRIQSLSRQPAQTTQGELFIVAGPPDSKRLTLHEILIPLHVPGETRLLGIAQFFLDGQNLAAELRGIDWSLGNQAASVLLIGGGLIFATLSWAFGRLKRTQAQLAQRSHSLLEANRALALASKTSAVGALSAHLLHELKSQLFGIQALLAGRRTSAADRAEPGWQTAVDSAQRMQKLIGQLLGIMRDEEGTANHY